MRRELIPHTQQLIDAEIARTSREKSIVTGRRQIAITDQQALLNVDPTRILIGEIEVYDDRKRPPR
jgi:hypothetical protein